MTFEKAPIYEDMLIYEVFPEVKKKGVFRLGKVSISDLVKEGEVEFFLILYFDSLASVKIFTGEQYEKAYISGDAKQVLARYDESAQHFELKKELIL
ncbi:MAG: hypothetical protein ACI9RU_002301 [Litorivivens sp.]|jgi:hypothetical protein